MHYTLPSRLIGTFVAATLAVTTIGTTPAYADRDDRAARAFATVLGIAVLGAIIHDNKKSDKVSRREVYREPVHKPRPVLKQRIAPKQLPRRVSRNLLPQNCLESFRTNGGRAQLFTQRCLQRNYAGVNRLPRKCLQRIRTRDGQRAGFGARCLSANGYKLSRR